MAILSLFGDNAGRGSFSFKIHRSLPEGFAVALGFENAIRWGETDAGSSIYGVVSKFFQFTETTKEPDRGTSELENLPTQASGFSR